MPDARPDYPTIDPYDRLLGALDGTPGTLSTRPTPIQVVEPITGRSQTYMVRTFRQVDEAADGASGRVRFTTFLEYVKGTGEPVIRIPLPPKVGDAMIRQRDALTSLARRRQGKAQAAARKKAGWKPTPPPPRRKKQA